MPTPTPRHRNPSRTGSTPPCTTRPPLERVAQVREQEHAAIDRLGDTVVLALILGHRPQRVERGRLHIGEPQTRRHVGGLAGIGHPFRRRPRDRRRLSTLRDPPPPKCADQQQPRPGLAVTVAGEVEPSLDVVPRHLLIGGLAQRPHPADRRLGDTRAQVRGADRIGCTGADERIGSDTERRHGAASRHPSTGAPRRVPPRRRPPRLARPRGRARAVRTTGPARRSLAVARHPPP